jgi:hypothetical protein
VRYVALVRPPTLRRIETIIESVGTVIPADDVVGLLSVMRSTADICAVIDPSLITPDDAAAIVRQFGIVPQSIIAYAPVMREAFEASIVLAQGTPTQFVFQGMVNEAAALRQALLLAPDAGLGQALTTALSPYLGVLPQQLRLTLTAMLQAGVGARTATALAAQSAIARRSMDRALEAAGLESTRFLIAAAQVVRVYRAVACSRIPFRRLAAMAGYASQRTLDHHFQTFLGCASGTVRKQPLPVADATRRIVTRLTTRPVSALNNGNGAERHLEQRRRMDDIEVPVSGHNTFAAR